MYKLIRPLLAAALLLVLNAYHAAAQQADTVQRLTYTQAQARFLNNNYGLLLKRFAVDSARAAVITARLFNNPEFSYENSLYDREHHKILPTYRNGGNYNFQLSQLFSLAGKRNKAIALASTDTMRSVYAYQDLLRTLKRSLAEDFYTIYYKQQTAEIYRQQITALTGVYNAFNQQYQKGNMAAKDPLRIQAQLLSLYNTYNDLQTDVNNAQADLKILLADNSSLPVMPVVPAAAKRKALTAQQLQQLTDAAMQNRPDAHYAESTITYAQQNLALQKAMAVPDVTLGVAHNLNGYDPQSYWGVNVSFALPLFNRNQGNVRAAEIGIKAADVQQRQVQNTIIQQVATAYNNAQRAVQLQERYKQGFTGSFKKLVDAAEQNYRRGNISLVEFLDYYQAYRDNLKQQNDLLLNTELAYQQLDYLTGTNIY